jgi:hypothetical protein
MKRSASWAATLGLAASIVASLGACREADSVVLVTVTAEAGATGVVQMRATLSNDAMSATNRYPQQVAVGAAAIAFPTMFSFTVARGRSGTLDVAIDGLDARSMAIANGDGSVTLSPGGMTELAITLRGGASLCGNKVIDTGEACDDGNRVSEGVCDFTCHHAGALDAGGAGGMGGAGSGMGGGTGTDGGRDTGSAGGRDGGTDGGGSGDAGHGDSGLGDVAPGEGGPTVCTKELLLNGDFNLGADDWSVTSSGRLLVYNENSVNPAIVPAPYSPPDLAWLGYDVVSETAMLQQTFNVPLNALSLTVSGYYIINTAEGICDCDVASIDLVSPVYTHHVHDWSNQAYNSDWTYFTTTFDISLAAGDDLTLQVSAKMDDGVITSFFFDDLSVTANFCP